MGAFEDFNGGSEAAGCRIFFEVAECDQRVGEALCGAFIEAGCAAEFGEAHFASFFVEGFEQAESFFEGGDVEGVLAWGLGVIFGQDFRLR